MASYLAWLAFSEAERRKALDLIQAFEDRDTRDELGIGTVRDALADLFFPGVSTIQTRARYFLFVPWIYKKLEEKEVPSSEIAITAREFELKLVDALCESLGENKGIIGYRARKSLKRLPSDIYWQALGVWGIRQFNGGRDAYHRSLDRHYTAAETKLTTEEVVAEMTTRKRNWHDVPPSPSRFPRNTDFDLTADEAEYLSLRILQAAPTRNSLLATLIARREVWQPEVEFPWLGQVFEWATAEQQEHLKHAETFSLVMLGAALLYNLILSQLRSNQSKNGSADLDSGIDYFQSELAAWLNDIEQFRPLLKSWNRRTFWELVTKEGKSTDQCTETFCERWFDLAINCTDRSKLLATDKEFYCLIAAREKQLKGPLSRITNPRALQQWGGESGAFRLTFRWQKARVIIRDIIEGLR